MSEYKLAQEIISRSDSNDWDTAKFEWELSDVYVEEFPKTCLCGHFPINEICVLKNKHNNQTATVGNVCVNKFIGLPSDRIFKAVKRVSRDEKKSLNKEAIHHAYKKGWINDWEYDFSIDTMRKRILSDNQLAKRKQVNEKMLKNMKRDK